MDVVGDLVARDRRSDDLAVLTDSRAGSYSYRKFCTNAWKAGNLLRHYGVRAGATVAVDAGESPTPRPILAFFGAALLGATVRFDPSAETDAHALVAPADALDRYDVGPRTQVIAYGERPETPGTVHFEAQLWSENPTAPPETVDSDGAVLATADERFTHRDLLLAAESVVDEYGLDGQSVVALRAPLREPAAVVAGVLAPLLAGGAILMDRSSRGTIAVARPDSSAPEARRVDLQNLR